MSENDSDNEFDPEDELSFANIIRELNANYQPHVPVRARIERPQGQRPLAAAFGLAGGARVQVQGAARGRARQAQVERAAAPRQAPLAAIFQRGARAPRQAQVERNEPPAHARRRRLRREDRSLYAIEGRHFQQATLNAVFAVVQQPPAVHDDRSRAELRARVPPRDANNLVPPRFQVQPGAEPHHPFIWEANRDPDRGRSNSPDEGRDGRRRNAEDGRLNDPPAVDDDQSADEPQVAGHRAANIANVGVAEEEDLEEDLLEGRADVGLPEEEDREDQEGRVDVGLPENEDLTGDRLKRERQRQGRAAHHRAQAVGRNRRPESLPPRNSRQFLVKHIVPRTIRERMEHNNINHSYHPTNPNRSLLVQDGTDTARPRPVDSFPGVPNYNIFTPEAEELLRNAVDDWLDFINSIYPGCLVKTGSCYRRTQWRRCRVGNSTYPALYFLHDVCQVANILFTSNVAGADAETFAIRYMAERMGERLIFNGRSLNTRGRGESKCILFHLYTIIIGGTCPIVILI